MAKYIRTKEGNIYQRFFKDKSIRGVGGGGCCDKNLNPIGETIIKESDTIEELCDYVFYVNELGTHRYLDMKELSKREIEIIKGHFKLGHYKDCKFCIEIGIGLIYVAKMNDKGELELV